MNKLPLRFKLVLLVLIPLVGMAFFAGRSAVVNLSEANEARDVDLLVHLSVHTGNLLHETQKERGATAVFLASGGEKFATELPAQYEATDARRDELAKFLTDHSGNLPDVVIADLASAMEVLGNLDDHRNSASALTSQTAETIGHYTEMNNRFLTAIASVATASSNSEIRGDSTAYLAFLNAKERTGIERAQLATVFGTDEFAPGQFATVVSLISAQEAYLGLFEDISDPDALSFFQRNQANPVVADIARMEAIAIENGNAGFGIDSEEWFDAMTKRIDLLKEVEDFLADGILATSSNTADIAMGAFIRSVLFALGLIALTTAIGFFTIVGLVRQLEDITTSAAEVAHDLTSVSISMGQSAGKTSNEANLASEAGEEVSKSVASVATAIEQLNSSIAEVARSANEASTVASNAVVAARSTSTTIAKLGDSSEEIGHVIKVINSIASQINLLALNTTIESARAGEAGKGFAVVANEVKQLSSQTAEATKEISDRIEAIQDDTAGAVEANLAISETIDQISEISATIATAVEEQSATTAEIDRSIEETATSTEDIARSINDVAAAAGNTRNSTRDAEASAHQMTQMVTDLKHLVSHGD